MLLLDVSQCHEGNRQLVDGGHADPIKKALDPVWRQRDDGVDVHPRVSEPTQIQRRAQLQPPVEVDVGVAVFNPVDPPADAPDPEDLPRVDGRTVCVLELTMKSPWATSFRSVSRWKW